MTVRHRACVRGYATGNGTARAVGTATGLKVPEGFQLAGCGMSWQRSLFPTGDVRQQLMRFVGGANNQLTFKASVPWPMRGGQTYKSTYSEVVLRTAGMHLTHCHKHSTGLARTNHMPVRWRLRYCPKIPVKPTRYATRRNW